MNTPQSSNFPPALADILARYGATVVGVHDLAVGETRPATPGVEEWMSGDGGYFPLLAPSLHERGWSVYPQQYRSRDPAIIDGRMLSHKFLTTRLPTADEVRWWGIQATMANVAVSLGAASGLFACDLDITDVALRNKVLVILREELGDHFFRHARRVKACLYFRLDPVDPVDATRKLPILDGEGKPTGHVIEILANGASSTVAGRHHKTGQPFGWIGANPHVTPKDHAAIVSKTKLQAALDRIDQEVAPLQGIKKYDRWALTPTTGAVEGGSVDARGVVKPGGRTFVEGVSYSKGKVVDGRETFLQKRSLRWVAANPGLAATEVGRHELAGHLADEAEATWAGWSEKYPSRAGTVGEALKKVCSAKGFYDRKPDAFRRMGREENGRPLLVQKVAVKVVRDEKMKGLSWLTDDLLGSIGIGSITCGEQDRKAAERAIVIEPSARIAEQNRVAGEVHAAIVAWIEEAYERAVRGDETPLRALRLLKAPVGAGKTSRLIELLAEYKRRRGPMGAPVMILMPSYANIEEAVTRAKRGRKASTAEVTALFKATVSAMSNEAGELGLDVGILTGRERGGCMMAEHMKRLMAAQLPTSGLCEGSDETPEDRAVRLRGNRGLKARRKAGDDVGPDERAPKAHCWHHPDNVDPKAPRDCPVIRTRRALLSKDIIFAPMAYATTPIPSEISKRVAALAIDERCVFEMLSTRMMPVRSLDTDRAPPPVSDEDKLAGDTPEGLLAERKLVCHFAMDALGRREDVALAIHRHYDRPRLAGCVESALKVVRRGQRDAKDVRPNMPLAELVRMLDKPTQSDLVEETGFWTLVQERLTQLAEDQLLQDLNGGALPASRLSAKGDRDARIQVLAAGVTRKDSPEQVRMSWRSKPNMADLPTLLLDASADVEMVRKVWCGREVVATEIQAYLHVRTIAVMDASYSASSLDPSGVADEKAANAISARLARVRRAENVAAFVSGQGRILTVAAKRVRKAMRVAYGEAPNVDTGHYGAVKGLDFAKRHKAVVTVGRHQFPTHFVDAMAAALTYDDDVPEVPFDANGNGLDAKGQPLGQHTVDRTYMLRDGRDMTIKVSEMPGYWGRKVERQFREEEQLQAMGRLRPVYRDDEPPLWFAFSKVLPEGVTIDAVTNLHSLSNPSNAGLVLDAIRRVGVIDEDLLRRQAPDLDGARSHAPQMRRLGIDAPGKASPFTAGVDVYEVTVEGKTRTVGVPAWHGEDAVENAIWDAYGRSGMEVQSVRRIKAGEDYEASNVKSPDKVDFEIGTRAERFEAEETARDVVIAAERTRLLTDPLNKVFEGGALLVSPDTQDVAPLVIRWTQSAVPLPEGEQEQEDADPVASNASAGQSPSGPSEAEPQPSSEPSEPGWPEPAWTSEASDWLDVPAARPHAPPALRIAPPLWP